MAKFLWFKRQFSSYLHLENVIKNFTEYDVVAEAQRELDIIKEEEAKIHQSLNRGLKLLFMAA
jgi:hypothetical protein